jgi:hypothetical protein
MTLRHKIQIKSLIRDVQEIEEVRKICLTVLDQRLTQLENSNP